MGNLSNAKNSSTYIKGFDGLRAISIIMVLLAHLELYSPFFERHPQYGRFIYLFSGVVGVNIFFCLSGFLITWLLVNEKRTYGNINFRRFYIRRFFRLLPPVLIFFLLLVPLVLLHVLDISKWSILLSFMYLYNYVPDIWYSAELGSTWSLALEEQYYLCWPFVIGFFRNRSKLFLSAFVVVLLCIVAKFFFKDANFSINGKTIFLGNSFHVDRFFLPAAGPIMIGSIFALLSINTTSVFLLKMKRRWLFLLAPCLYVFPLYTPKSLLPFSDLVQAIGISILLLYLFVCNNKNNVFASMLEFSPLSYVGRISYGIYVYQSFFLTTGSEGELTVQQFPLNIVLTIGVAIVSYHCWEKPVMRYRDRVLTKFNLNR